MPWPMTHTARGYGSLWSHETKDLLQDVPEVPGALRNRTVLQCIRKQSFPENFGRLACELKGQSPLAIGLSWIFKELKRRKPSQNRNGFARGICPDGSRLLETT